LSEGSAVFQQRMNPVFDPQFFEQLHGSFGYRIEGNSEDFDGGRAFLQLGNGGWLSIL
jgi:hypothetical protein